MILEKIFVSRPRLLNLLTFKSYLDVRSFNPLYYFLDYGVIPSSSINFTPLEILMLSFSSPRSTNLSTASLLEICFHTSYIFYAMSLDSLDVSFSSRYMSYTLTNHKIHYHINVLTPINFILQFSCTNKTC